MSYKYHSGTTQPNQMNDIVDLTGDDPGEENQGGENMDLEIDPFNTEIDPFKETNQ